METGRQVLIIMSAIFLTVSSVGATDLKVGQIWKYKNRIGEDKSTITILRIDRIDAEKIIHIRIDGLRIKKPQPFQGFNENVPHIPIAETGIENSVTKMLGVTESLPPFEEGYKIWKEAFDKKKAGYFSISVSECLDQIEKSIAEQNEKNI